MRALGACQAARAQPHLAQLVQLGLRAARAWRPATAQLVTQAHAIHSAAVELCLEALQLERKDKDVIAADGGGEGRRDSGGDGGRGCNFLHAGTRALMQDACGHCVLT